MEDIGNLQFGLRDAGITFNENDFVFLNKSQHELSFNDT